MVIQGRCSRMLSGSDRPTSAGRSRAHPSTHRSCEGRTIFATRDFCNPTAVASEAEWHHGLFV